MTSEKNTEKVFFLFFFYNKLCIKEKRKVVLLIWGPYVSMTFAVNKRHLSFVKFNDYNKNPLDNHIAILHC